MSENTVAAIQCRQLGNKREGSAVSHAQVDGEKSESDLELW